MKENKKDILPIILYIGLYLGLQVLAGILYYVMHPENALSIPDEFLYTTIIVIYIITFIVFALVYRKKLLGDAKRLTRKQLAIIVVASIVVTAVNWGLTNLITKFDATMTNQDFAVTLVDNYKVMAIIAVCICAPIVEELVYRYSISTIIKNDIAFLIVSSLIFGLVHGIGIVTIVYVFLGACFAICYLKTGKNVVASSIIHIINNTIAAVMLLL